MTDFRRVMTGVIVDSQYTIHAISNHLGTVIKAYADAEIGKVTVAVLPYRIENENGNLMGYFTVRTKFGNGILYQKQIRPAFHQFDSIISQEISNFIHNGSFKLDLLL